MAGRRVEDFRERSTREVLPADAWRQETASGGAVEMATVAEGDSPRHAADGGMSDATLMERPKGSDLSPPKREGSARRTVCTPSDGRRGADGVRSRAGGSTASCAP